MHKVSDSRCGKEAGISASISFIRENTEMTKPLQIKLPSSPVRHGASARRLREHWQARVQKSWSTTQGTGKPRMRYALR